MTGWYFAMIQNEALVLEHLRHIRTTVDGLRDDMRDVKGRLGTLESQCASISNRVDRLDGRVERIERDFFAVGGITKV